MHTAQALKIEGGQLHGGGAWMGLTIPVQVPTLDVKLAAREYQLDLHSCSACASSRLAKPWKRLYHTGKWTYP